MGGPEAQGSSGEAQIRELDDARLDQAVRLWESASESSGRSPFSLAEVLGAVAAGQPALVALVDERVVGAVAARVDGQRAWVLRWSVDAAHRRRGIGSALLRALERKVQRAGVLELSVLTSDGDDAVGAAMRSGYALRGEMRYLEKHWLQASAADDRVEELGGVWPSADHWLAIGGMEQEKELIERSVILPLAERDVADRHGVVAASAVMLFGPPGTGKTTFAKAIAGRLGWSFVELFPSQLDGADAHGRAGALRDLFERLLDLEGVVVFIDEVEDIASHRQNRPETQALANELLKLIPRFRDGDSRLLVVATNSVHELDGAFTRPGRFDYLLPVGPPDARAREGIWQRYVAGITDADVDLTRLAERSQYFSAADIEFAARKAAQAAFERSLATGEHAPATTEDFIEALDGVRPSITAAMAREFEEDIERFARF